MKKKQISDFVEIESQPPVFKINFLDEAIKEVKDIGISINQQQNQDTSNYKIITHTEDSRHSKVQSQIKDKFTEQKSQMGYFKDIGNSLYESATQKKTILQTNKVGIEEYSCPINQTKYLKVPLVVHNQTNALFEVSYIYHNRNPFKAQFTVLLRDHDQKQKYVTCIQEEDIFNYQIQHQILFKMIHRLDHYFVEDEQNQIQNNNPPKINFRHVNQTINQDSRNHNKKGINISALMSYCQFNGKKISSKITYNPFLKRPIICSEKFDLQNVQASILNTIIFDSSKKQVCSIYEENNKVMVESSADVSTHILLLLAMSRMDQYRRCCSRRPKIY